MGPPGPCVHMCIYGAPAWRSRSVFYYGTLYTYTPEVLPFPRRATGNGAAIAFNRFIGTMSVVIAMFAHTSTSVPVFVFAALFGVLALIAVCFPFEPARGRSV
ncbi:hypothetical protein diail_6529 [Diaporthe ilicicola]|nr:hypothetical protein diail_6529 [Diaporthe ilicicola]